MGLGGLLGGGGGGLIGGPLGMVQGLPLIGELMPGQIAQSLPREPTQEELGYGIAPSPVPGPYMPYPGLLPPTGPMPTGPGSLQGRAVSPVAQAYGGPTPQAPKEGNGRPPERGGDQDAAAALTQMGGGGLLGGLGGALGGFPGALGGMAGGVPGMAQGAGSAMQGGLGGLLGGGGFPMFGAGIPGLNQQPGVFF